MLCTLATTLLLPLFVNGRLSANGSLSASTNAIIFTNSTSGVGGYILAALGATSTSDISDSLSNVSANPPYTSADFPLNASASVPSSLGNASTSVSSSLVSHTSTPALPEPSTICVENITSLCYTDISYSAIPIAPTGTGSAYASLCISAQSSYISVSDSWTPAHQFVSTITATVGDDSYSTLSYYSNASTLCDGHPRVTYYPAILLSTSLTTIPGSLSTEVYSVTYNKEEFPFSYPSCTFGTSDCDNLWQAYSTSSSEWNLQQSGAPALLPATPLCENSANREALSSADTWMSGCGSCTIFGDGVQLLYFPPTSVSRDMCATTPSASVTYYHEDAATIYDGMGTVRGNFTGETAVLDGKTFTSGTAYISIKTVYIGDRCRGTIGTPVTDALVAMPSESLLSLRYTQWQASYFLDIETITGYPFNFGDLQKPIPYSAWAGQGDCLGPNAYDYNCDVIYEDRFRPNLAIPPAIRKLRPEWENCQLWYAGLYDPPRALQPATAVATATLPNNIKPDAATAEPSSWMASSIPKATASRDPVFSRASSATAAGEPASATQEPSSSISSYIPMTTTLADSIFSQAPSAATAGETTGDTPEPNSSISSSILKTTTSVGFISSQASSAIGQGYSSSAAQAADKTFAADTTEGSGKPTRSNDNPVVTSARKGGPETPFTKTETVGPDEFDGIALGGQTLSTGRETFVKDTTLPIATGDIGIDSAISSYFAVEQTSQTSAQQVSSNAEHWTTSEAETLQMVYTTHGSVIKEVSTIHTIIEGPGGASTVTETTTLLEDDPATTVSGVLVTSPVTVYTVAKGAGVTTYPSGAAETLLDGEVTSLTSLWDVVSASSSSTSSFSTTSTIDPSSATSSPSSDRSNSRVTTPSTSATVTAGTISNTLTMTKTGSSLSKLAILQIHYTYLAAAAVCMYFVV